jgi:hypothetical protein
MKIFLFPSTRAVWSSNIDWSILLIKNPKHPVLHKNILFLVWELGKIFSGTPEALRKIFFQKTPEFRPKKKTPLAHI